MPGWTLRLRFPYLKEGNTAEKRDGIPAEDDIYEKLILDALGL